MADCNDEELLDAVCVFVPLSPDMCRPGALNGVIRAECPYCGSSHMHGWGGKRMCGNCGNYYVIDEVKGLTDTE